MNSAFTAPPLPSLQMWTSTQILAPIAALGFTIA
uniref:CKX3 n=1 Tax=Arundo donax TaxID=35708 RepID=A0A0A9F9V0_ARUDO